MKKQLLLLTFIILSLEVFAQADFRGVKWGMSISEVKAHETAPLTKEEKDLIGASDGQRQYSGVNLIYENVTVAGIGADLHYHFDNGKLTKIRVLYRPSHYVSTDKKVSETVRQFKPLFDGLVGKGFKYSDPLRCGDHAYSGPDRSNPNNIKIFREYRNNITPEVLSIIDKMVEENNYSAAFYRMTSNRSDAIVQFNTKYSQFTNYVVVMFELLPSYAIKSAIDKSDF